MFGRKRIKELEQANINLNRRLQQWEDNWKVNEDQKMALMAKIREMDQLIFSMSQCQSWAEMQPIFAALKTFTDQRMIDESGRIQNVLIPEMKKAYK